ncbi:cobalamin B12-binding domain-containing protein [Stigmatella erecta]|uniref:Methanogenic corrinoid protein MtbC1 n=1 Tax=Stigmatella erecta TaxID=83460 RepID=A0A1I0KED4_9BACT|nr:cobalamin-dependent protein [Stigmatella erecta]SEU22543.1 Methanogenic corrinoid protein MtbC1 [Stigmatella erecta]
MRPSVETDPLAQLQKRYLAAQLAGDRREALRLLVDEGLLQGIPLQDLHLKVIQPAQYEIGRLWQENHISVAQEHLATAISQLALSHLYRHLPRDPSNGKVIMLSCVEGELHEVGARMAADFLEMAGFDVRFLGANVPSHHLVRMVREQTPDLLALSVTMTYHLPALRDAVAVVREAVPHLPIAVGGLAFSWVPGLEKELDVAFFGKDARELVASACKTLGV